MILTETVLENGRGDTMDRGFNKDAFMNWLNTKFPRCLHHYWTRSLVEYLIDYALDHESISKDQFCYFLSDMLPEVEFLEVARFCEDGKLTSGTLKALGRKGNK